MYASQQLLRAHHDEWLRQAEIRRLVKQAAAEPAGSTPPARRGRFRRPARLLGRALPHA
jgi:hypothetical protein